MDNETKLYGEISRHESDVGFLIWIHERLVHVHGEREIEDYMHKLRAVIYEMDPSKQTKVSGQGGNRMESLKMKVISKHSLDDDHVNELISYFADSDDSSFVAWVRECEKNHPAIKALKVWDDAVKKEVNLRLLEHLE